MDRKIVPHTLLFSGPPGVGKKLAARRFLNSLFCPGENPPCLKCAACLQIAGGVHPDIIELLPDDKGRIPIGSQDREEPGSVRWLIDRLSKRSISGICGVIIDGIESISIAGQNALLKTIEEPQPGTHIVLLASNKSQILPTILSRSSEISFQPLLEHEVEELLCRLLPGHDRLIAEISGGSIELALILAESETMPMIMELCKSITRHIARGIPFDYDVTRFQKSIGYESLLDILISIYRTILLSSLYRRDVDVKLHDITMSDEKKIAKLLKIFLALKKGLIQNLNIKISLKGMLYAIDSMNEIGIPELYYL